ICPVPQPTSRTRASPGIAASSARASSLRRARARSPDRLMRGGEPGNGAAEEKSRPPSHPAPPAGGRSGTPPPAGYTAAHAPQRRPVAPAPSAPPQAGQARRSTGASMSEAMSEDRVEERRQRLHAGGDGQEQAGHAQEHEQRHQPAA